MMLRIGMRSRFERLSGRMQCLFILSYCVLGMDHFDVSSGLVVEENREGYGSAVNSSLLPDWGERPRTCTFCTGSDCMLSRIGPARMYARRFATLAWTSYSVVFIL
jgi:hypothetical protein